METQFTHLKIKKPDYVPPVVQAAPVKDAAPVEEVKKPVPPPTKDEPNRKQRKLQQYLKESVKRKADSGKE